MNKTIIVAMFLFFLPLFNAEALTIVNNMDVDVKVTVGGNPKYLPDVPASSKYAGRCSGHGEKSGILVLKNDYKNFSQLDHYCLKAAVFILYINSKDNTKGYCLGNDGSGIDEATPRADVLNKTYTINSMTSCT